MAARRAAWIAFSAAVLLRVLLHVIWPSALDSDECAEALMAIDLKNNPSFIVGWWGQHYVGSLEIYLLTAMHAVVGSSPASIRILFLLVAIVQLHLLMQIAWGSSGPRAAAIAMCVMCLLSPYAYSFALRARGYQFMIVLALGSLALLTHLLNSARTQGSRRSSPWLLLGLLIGWAVWTNELALVLVVAMALLIVGAPKERLRRTVLTSAGMLAGYLPRIIYNVRNEFYGFKFLIGSVANVSQASFEAHGWKSVFHRTGRLDNLPARGEAILEGLGAPLLVLTLVAILIYALTVRRGKTEGAFRWLPFGLILSFILTVGMTSTPRYVTVIIPYCALLTGIVLGERLPSGWISTRRIAIAAAVSCTLSVAQAERAWLRGEPVLEIALTRFLQERGYEHGISDVRTAHKVMYYAEEGMYVSSLGAPPFRTKLMSIERRIAANGAEFVVFEIENGSDRIHGMEKYLISRGIDGRLDVVADRYAVFHSFSEPVFPGSFLPEGEKPFYSRHSPKNVRKIRDERANILIGRVSDKR